MILYHLTVCVLLCYTLFNVCRLEEKGSAMIKNKRIGIIMNRVYRDTNQQIISGILNQAYSLGISSAVFSTEEQHQDEDGTFGENDIFSAINFDLFDGFIFAPFTFINVDTVKYITDLLSNKCMKPVICIGNDFGEFEFIWQDDRAEMFNIVMHMIEKHNCKKIVCMTGPKGESVSMEREYGYRDAMKKSGLEVSDEDIVYGDFWKNSAKELAKEFADGKRPLADAVVCANDCMAISLCEALESYDINVPKDIRITGYDGSFEAQYHNPGICTYRTSYSMLGIKTMARLYNIMSDGEECKLYNAEGGKLITNTSCGCDANFPKFSTHMIANNELIEQRFLDNNMSNILLNTNNLNEFSKAASNWFYLCLNEKYYDKENFNVCLYSDWDVVDSDGLARKTQSESHSEKMFALFESERFELFPSKEMIPPKHLKNDKPSVSFFIPIHYGKHTFGYSVLTLYEIADSFTMSYPRFCKDLGNSLECLCIRNRLKSMTYRAFLSETRDALTGAYRAATRSQFWNQITERVKLYDETLHVCICSISGLQQINEAYGQVEGDQVIMQIAAIIMGCCNNGEICVRSNGNEFWLIGSTSNLIPNEDSLESKILSKIEHYNHTSGKPYLVQVYTASESISAQLIPDNEAIYQKLKKQIEKKKNSGYLRTEQVYYADFTKLRHDIYVNPEEAWSVNICCEKLGMSMSHFQRLYKSIFNTSCMRDIQSSKLRHAKNLLLHTNETLQIIAEKCGYDYSHFMRLFKKEVGMTPTEYRHGFKLMDN